MRLLDLFCGAGGAAMGYHRAGFAEIVGVDINPQPRYPFEFVQSDWESALATIPGMWGDEPYAIHASPPCQRYSTMTAKWGRQENHPDLVQPVQEALDAFAEDGTPFVIENVSGAPLRNPVMLCGSMFGLGAEGYGLRRHRLFETSFDLWAPSSCAHVGPALPVYGHPGGSSKRDGLRFPGISAWRAGMGIDWMNQHELAESIPPAYTEYIGRYLLAAVRDRVFRIPPLGERPARSPL